jgi:putative heme transporter
MPRDDVPGARPARPEKITAMAAPAGGSESGRAHAAPRLRQALRTARRPTWRLVVDWMLTAAGIGIAVWRLAPTLAAVDEPGRRLGELRWAWVGIAVVAAVVSLGAYGELYRRMLAAGGARLGFGTVQAVNFIGNALTQTVPSAGPTAGIAYSVAAFRIRGVDTGLSLWTSLLAALLSTVVLAVLGPLALAYDGLIPLAAGWSLCAALALTTWVVWRVLRRPESLRRIARAVAAAGRRLPVVRNAKWVASESGRADAVSNRIALLRPTFAQWSGFFGIALFSWGLDYLTVAACVAATADTVPWPAVAAGYLAVQASIALQVTPAGAGAAEAGLLAALVAGGLTAPSAALAVVLFRSITWPILACAGWLVFLGTAHKRAARA